MIIELPGFDFEKPSPDVVGSEPLFEKVRQFLDTKRIDRTEYGIGSQPTAGLGEILIQNVNSFWLVCTTERGKNFDVALFTSQFHAVNYFIFRLTASKETIDWSTI